MLLGCFQSNRVLVLFSVEISPSCSYLIGAHDHFRQSSLIALRKLLCSNPPPFPCPLDQIGSKEPLVCFLFASSEVELLFWYLKTAVWPLLSSTEALIISTEPLSLETFVFLLSFGSALRTTWGLRNDYPLHFLRPDGKQIFRHFRRSFEFLDVHLLFLTPPAKNGWKPPPLPGAIGPAPRVRLAEAQF